MCPQQCVRNNVSSFTRALRTSAREASGHEAKHVCEILNSFVLLVKFFGLIVNENLLLLNLRSCFFHLVAFIWEY